MTEESKTPSGSEAGQPKTPPPPPKPPEPKNIEFKGNRVPKEAPKATGGSAKER